ncbi:magnesium transporter [Candidatus Sumerlaeota bacterium]|nr:magnesium transporter [Candidatus Sumerlaeota bacterium]
MIGEIQLPEIEELIASRNWRALKTTLAEWQPHDVADLLEILNPRDRVILFRLLPKAMATEVFERMEGEAQRELLEAFSDAEAAPILEEMSPDDRTDLLEELPHRVTRRALRLLSPEQRKIAQSLLAYPHDSVGRLMTPDFAKVKKHWLCGQAIKHLRSLALNKETIYYLYVVDDENHLIGVISLRNLVLADPESPLWDVAEDDPISVSAVSDQEEAVKILRRYDLQALPVVDSANHLLGIVTFDDIMDVQAEETTEDMQIMAAIVPTEKPYFETSFSEIFAKRAIWLIILGIAGIFSASVIRFYHSSLPSDLIVGLAFFIPLLMGTGGNAGSQVAALMIRSLATGEIIPKDFLQLAKRELLMGIVLGICLALVGFLIAWIVNRDPLIGITLGLAMVLTIATANFVGLSLPLLFKAVGLDPAFMSGPILTTITDVLGLIIYFNMTHLILRI